MVFLQVTSVLKCYHELSEPNAKVTVRFLRKRDAQGERKLSFEVY